MNSLHEQCCNHLQREAVARCPECGLFYCRECVVEHEDRVLCAGCLRKLTAQNQRARGRFAQVGQYGLSVLGLVFAWLAFYWLGRLLLLAPPQFHDGTLWKTTLSSG